MNILELEHGIFMCRIVDIFELMKLFRLSFLASILGTTSDSDLRNKTLTFLTIFEISTL